MHAQVFVEEVSAAAESGNTADLAINPIGHAIFKFIQDVVTVFCRIYEVAVYGLQQAYHCPPLCLA